jgi:hypothetical protein
MNFVDVVGPFVLIVVILACLVAVYLRQGRNEVLEEIVEHGKVGPIDSFRGTLAVEENRPNFLLRLRKNSEGRRLQFLYRWVIGVGPQAVFDDVTFDGSRRSVELARGNQHRSVSFSEFSAVRMRETAGRHGHVSVWHVELVSLHGPHLLFLSSERSHRQTGFEQTASVAKAVSAIMSLPVQVVVDGKVWTPGWPPKDRIALS